MRIRRGHKQRQRKTCWVHWERRSRGWTECERRLLKRYLFLIFIKSSSFTLLFLLPFFESSEQYDMVASALATHVADVAETEQMELAAGALARHLMSQSVQDLKEICQRKRDLVLVWSLDEFWSCECCLLSCAEINLSRQHLSCVFLVVKGLYTTGTHTL